MTNYSRVTLVGSVAEINLETRDLTVLTQTPRGKAVKITVHMWKAPSDGDDPAWAERPEWKNVITVGMQIVVCGHLGNNARIIATGWAPALADNPTEDGCADEDDEADLA